MSEQQAKWMRDIERRIIAPELDRPKFEDLYRLAWQICLVQEPPDISLETERCVTFVDPMIPILGARGLRNALELSTQRYHHVDSGLSPDEDYLPDKNYFFVGYDSPLRRPNLFNNSPDQDVLRKIEAFGAGLLDEAYKILGTDVRMKIDQLRDAQNDEQQMEVLAWLYGRLLRIKKTSSDLQEEQRTGPFYHPARLSPKLIGQFPHQNFRPTCLGMSIIASSFFEQAGMDHMHAGVMRTYHEDMLATYRLALDFASRNKHAGASEAIMYDVRERIKALRVIMPDDGFHALSVTRLKSGRWYCMDANFEESYVVEDNEHCTGLSDAFARIGEFSQYGVPVEETVFMAQSSMPNALATISANAKFDFDLAAAEEVLMDDNTESLSQRLARVVHDSLELELNDVSQPLKEVFDAFFVEQQQFPQNESEFLYALMENILTYVIWDMDPDEFLQRCRDDEAFRQRRLADIRSAIYMAVADLAGSEADIYAMDPREYRLWGDRIERYVVLECGGAAARIGAAVLSDFDANSIPTQQLSPSFWLTHWSSLIPVTETRGRSPAHASEVPMEFVAGDLNYAHQYGVIKEYRESLRDDTNQED